MPLTASISPEQRGTGYTVKDGRARRRGVTVASVQIDPHSQGGFVLRRLAADGGDVHSTKHDTVDEAKQTAALEFNIPAKAWSGNP